MKKFDITKPFCYRNGDKAELLADDITGLCPIMCKRTDKYGIKSTTSHDDNGVYIYAETENYSFDLINIPVKHEYWANVYRFKSGTGVYIGDPDLYESQEEAVSGIQKNFDHVATVKIEWEE